MVQKIFLIGFMGCGKSAVAAKLSSLINCEYIDLDAIIEKKEGISITNIFKMHGESYFRTLETEILKSFDTDPRTLIIACGGGTPCFNNNIELINRSGLSVYLKTSVDTLYRRLLNESSKRPLIADKPEAELKLFIEMLLKQREEYYEKCKLIINTDELSGLEVANKIKEYISR